MEMSYEDFSRPPYLHTLFIDEGLVLLQPPCDSSESLAGVFSDFALESPLTSFVAFWRFTACQQKHISLPLTQLVCSSRTGSG